MFVRLNVCMYGPTYVCLFVCMYVCLFVCLFVWMWCVLQCLKWYLASYRIYADQFLFVCMFVRLNVPMYGCTYYVCVYVCMGLCTKDEMECKEAFGFAMKKRKSDWNSPRSCFTPFLCNRDMLCFFWIIFRNLQRHLLLSCFETFLVS
jgi:hypothetical protein